MFNGKTYQDKGMMISMPFDIFCLLGVNVKLTDETKERVVFGFMGNRQR